MNKKISNISTILALHTSFLNVFFSLSLSLSSPFLLAFCLISFFESFVFFFSTDKTHLPLVKSEFFGKPFKLNIDKQRPYVYVYGITSKTIHPSFVWWKQFHWINKKKKKNWIVMTFVNAMHENLFSAMLECSDGGHLHTVLLLLLVYVRLGNISFI